MILKPDLDAVYIDPFSATPMMIICCDIVEPSTGELYSRDPRSTAKRAEAFVKSSGAGDTVYVGPEAEFFMFDDVKFYDGYTGNGFKIDDIELPTNSDKDYEGGNLAHRPRAKGGYFPVAPVDSCMDIRGEMVSTMLEMGLPCDKHHHEVASAQHELGLTFGTLVTTADRMQIYKYVVHMVAQAYGKTATFMPKPIMTDNGSGMHTHISIWEKGKPLFAGNGYAGLSDMCLYFIGGVIKHAKALNAFTNPTTNSYKRLVPGYEAPVLLAYSARNRSASCRIPYGAGAKAKRVEFRFPDAMANPYLCYAALLMAGPRRGEEQDPPGRSDGQEPLRPAAGRSSPRFRPCAARCAKRWNRSKRTTPSCSKAACSPPTRSRPIWNSSGRKCCAGKPRRRPSSSTCTTPPRSGSFPSLPLAGAYPSARFRGESRKGPGRGRKAPPYFFGRFGCRRG